MWALALGALAENHHRRTKSTTQAASTNAMNSPNSYINQQGSRRHYFGPRPALQRSALEYLGRSGRRWAMKRYLTNLAAVLVVMAATVYAGAQVQPGVGRVSLINGDVTMQRGDSGDWVNARLNTPLVPGDKVATGHDSRAEI